MHAEHCTFLTDFHCMSARRSVLLSLPRPVHPHFTVHCNCFFTLPHTVTYFYNTRAKCNPIQPQ